VHFEPERSIVYIDVLHPEIFYANAAQLIKEIKTNTFWTPEVTRIPSIKSAMTNLVLSMLRSLPKDRKTFLKRTGQQIYSDPPKKLEFVRLTCLGGFRQVGRSSLLFQTNTSDVLFDCGIDVGYSDKQMLPIFNTPGFNIGSLKAVVISHAHLDHVGALPLLFKYGFNGPVYCTTAVRDQMVLALLDQLDLAKHGNSKPLFREEDIRKLVLHTICLPYDLTTNIASDVRITLKNAGHTLGSAMISAVFFGENTAYSALYTGDMKFGEDIRLLDRADNTIMTNDTLIVESTYGGEEDVQVGREEVESNLISIIEETIARKGNVIIPVLASGRAQDIMLVLSNYYRKTHRNIKIYLDGSLWDITAIYTAYPEFQSEIF
ncbi:MAG: beta-CASP ribonuclease aCPSF1, partial [Euryarchaeota archaeon HGW-Euryarchaeota-1]